MTDESTKAPNPRGKRPGSERRLPQRPPAGMAIWYGLGFLLLLAVGQSVFFSAQHGETISYSDFKAHVRAGRVQEVTISPETVRGLLRPGEGVQQPRPFNAVRIEDPKLVEELERHGV